MSKVGSPLKRKEKKRKLAVDWYDDCRIAINHYRDKWNPMPGSLNVEIGLRSDGVVMWRKLKEQ